jgi:hypothetical protein
VWRENGHLEFFRRFIKDHPELRPGIDATQNISETQPKPTADNLYRAGDCQLANSKYTASRFGENDTEYYSACGHDDYLAERAEWQKVYGIACRVAARRVKWAELNGYSF